MVIFICETNKKISTKRKLNTKYPADKLSTANNKYQIITCTITDSPESLLNILFMPNSKMQKLTVLTLLLLISYFLEPDFDEFLSKGMLFHVNILYVEEYPFVDTLPQCKNTVSRKIRECRVSNTIPSLQFHRERSNRRNFAQTFEYVEHTICFLPT